MKALKISKQINKLRSNIEKIFEKNYDRIIEYKSKEIERIYNEKTTIAYNLNVIKEEFPNILFLIFLPYHNFPQREGYNQIFLNNFFGDLSIFISMDRQNDNEKEKIMEYYFTEGKAIKDINEIFIKPDYYKQISLPIKSIQNISKYIINVDFYYFLFLNLHNTLKKLPKYYSEKYKHFSFILRDKLTRFFESLPIKKPLDFYIKNIMGD